MTTTASKPSIRELRAEAQRLGITTKSAGGSIEELLREARENEDPLGYLAIHAPSGDVPSSQTVVDETPEADESEPIGDVSAPIPESSVVEPPVIRDVSLTVPLCDASFDRCYISTHTEVRLSREQGITLRRLHFALDATGARLSNNRRVIHLADAIKWMIEQVGNAQ